MVKNYKLADIVKNEDTTKDINIFLSEIGCEIYEIRESAEFPKRYQYVDYVRTNFLDTSYSGHEGPTWRKGTPIFSLCYTWSYNGGGDYLHVTFPQSWIDQDWRKLEEDRTNKEYLKVTEQNRINDEKNRHLLEEQERAIYEQLKTKFGD